MDLFASHHNSQLHRYFSWTPDPGAEAINAFHQTWSKMNLWANPPWILIPRILSKLIREKATMTILVPWWETAPWFPLLLDLLIEPPLVILYRKIVQEERNPQTNPFCNSLANFSYTSYESQSENGLAHYRMHTFYLVETYSV